VSIQITPTPTPEEAAVLVTAVEMFWPKPVLVSSVSTGPDPLGWRFSGRWWGGPASMARQRPWAR
jgi:hypothetical protein